jgi:predicted metal-dependent phosphoesterase TrpH
MKMELSFDLHVHTTCSDGFLSPEQIVVLAQRKGLSGLAITDHNTINGAIHAKNFIENNGIKNFKVIVGAEISTTKGHIIGLFLKEEINSRDFRTVVEEIKEQGGIVVAAHPVRIPLFNQIRKNPILRLSPGDFKFIDFIEVWNSQNKKLANALAKSLSSQHQKPYLVGSDAHFSWELGRAKVMINTEDTTDEAIKFSLLQQKYCLDEPLGTSLFSYYLNAVINKYIRRRAY